MPTFWQKTLETISPWLLDHGLKILAILVIALLIRRFGGVFIEKTVRRLVTPNRFLSKEAERKREDTLIRIFDTSLVVLVWILAGLMMLEEAGTNIAPGDRRRGGTGPGLRRTIPHSGSHQRPVHYPGESISHRRRRVH